MTPKASAKLPGGTITLLVGPKPEIEIRLVVDCPAREFAPRNFLVESETLVYETVSGGTRRWIGLNGLLYKLSGLGSEATSQDLDAWVRATEGLQRLLGELSLSVKERGKVPMSGSQQRAIANWLGRPAEKRRRDIDG